MFATLGTTQVLLHERLVGLKRWFVLQDIFQNTSFFNDFDEGLEIGYSGKRSVAQRSDFRHKFHLHVEYFIGQQNEEQLQGMGVRKNFRQASITLHVTGSIKHDLSSKVSSVDRFVRQKEKCTKVLFQYCI